MIKVSVEHDGYNWVAIPECGGSTSARCIEQLADRVCEVVELMTGSAVTPDQLRLDVHVPGAELTAAAVAALREAGCSVRDIGALIGVSHQRVHQLVGQASTPSPLTQRTKPAARGPRR